MNEAHALRIDVLIPPLVTGTDDTYPFAQFVCVYCTFGIWYGAGNSIWSYILTKKRESICGCIEQKLFVAANMVL